MSQSKFDAHDNDLLRAIGLISSCLTKDDALITSNNKIAEIICNAASADSSAIYKREYLPDGQFCLERISNYSKPGSSNFELPEKCAQESFNSECWAQLNRLKPSHVVNCLDSEGQIHEFYALPLFFENRMYGILALGGLSVDSNSPLEIFLTSICNLIELFLSRSNAHKHFSDVFNSFPNPSFIMNSDEKISCWNKANEELTGWRADKIINKSNYTSSLPYYGTRRPMVANLIMKPDSDWQSTYFEFLQDKDTINALAFCPALPGGGGYLRTNTTRLYDINNRLRGAIHTVRDVTLERKMRENLKSSESLYKSIADFAGVGILLVGDNEVIYANEQAEEFIGAPKGKLIYEDFLSWVQFNDANNIQELIGGLLKNKEKPVRFEFKAQRSNNLFYFNALAQLISHDGRDVVHFVIDDVSEQKKLDRHARLTELKLIHEERLTSLGIMAAGIAHELNQPLNTIRVVTDGFLFCNEKGWGMDRDELVDNIEMISKQVLRMSTVIKNIRNFSRDDLSEEFTDVSVNDAVANVFSMIGRQMEAHNVQIEINLAENIPTVMAPLNQLEQVVTNLLINARQAFDSCPHENWSIRVETSVQNANVILEVSDNATGIPQDLTDKIFYPFFTTKQVGKGTGLGLSICQTIVASMKGKLDAYNNDQGGATFVVSIPLVGDV